MNEIHNKIEMANENSEIKKESGGEAAENSENGVKQIEIM